MSEEIRANVGLRLKEERERLGLSQTALGGIVGSSRRAVVAWEGGDTMPGADALALLSSEGLDVLYVVAGQRNSAVSASLSSDESTLVARYRQSSPVLRAYLQEFGSALAAGNTVSIGGDVGQSIAGDQSNTGQVSFNVGKRK